ncbi:MAG: ribosome maturation factor RimP [Kineosporiaceae bacterium]|jgi:ribosome maturation factor RimP
MAASQVDGLRELAGAAVAGAGLVLEDVTITSAGRRRVVRIVVDLPADRLGGVPLEAVAQASQAVSAALDTSPVLGQAPYTLEVTSPGVSRPLTQRRHWSRARRRLVEVRLRDGGTVTGRVRAVDDDGIELDGTPAVRLPWDRVERGAVQIEFGSSEEESD